MSRAPSAFRQRDVTAAVKAVVAAGQKVARVELNKDGRVILIMVDAEAASAKIRHGGETSEDVRKLL
jgi:hypothetical protein